MLAISVCNLSGTLIELPMVIISNFKCKWDDIYDLKIKNK